MTFLIGTRVPPSGHIDNDRLTGEQKSKWWKYSASASQCSLLEWISDKQMRFSYTYNTKPIKKFKHRNSADCVENLVPGPQEAYSLALYIKTHIKFLSWVINMSEGKN